MKSLEGFDLVVGSLGLLPDEIAHVMIPGRGRSADGMDLSSKSNDRVQTAGDFYEAAELEQKNGVIVL